MAALKISGNAEPSDLPAEMPFNFRDVHPKDTEVPLVPKRESRTLAARGEGTFATVVKTAFPSSLRYSNRRNWHYLPLDRTLSAKQKAQNIQNAS